MIWLVYRTDRIGYDEYDAHIVVADTKEEVVEILDREFHFTGNWWVDGKPKEDDIIFEKLSEREESGLVLSSFNAG